MAHSGFARFLWHILSRLDRRRGKTLVPPRHDPTQDDGGGGEGHVHTPGKDDDGHKGLRPVRLVDEHCCNNNAYGEEGRHGENQGIEARKWLNIRPVVTSANSPLMAIVTS